MASVNNNNDNNTANGSGVKRLRSSEPDLKVILGSSDDETVQWYHAPTLASKSNYIDTMLAVPMRERDDYVISFPDIKPDVWAKMMQFLDSPIAAREMSAKDVVEVAPLYDKYEFVEGMKLCSYVMMDYLSFNSICNNEKTYSVDVDLIINLLVVAYGANMEDVLNEGMKYIWAKMGSDDIPYGRLMFTDAQLDKLLPLIKHTKPEGASGLLSDMIEQPDFSKKYISNVQGQAEFILLMHCISHIEVLGTDCDADGSYETIGGWNNYEQCDDYNSTFQWGDQQVSFRVMYGVPISLQGCQDEDKFEGWSIVRRSPPTGPFYEDWEVDIGSVVIKKCWIAPHSTNDRIPPLKGWIPCDPLAKGNPTIKYVLKDYIVG